HSLMGYVPQKGVLFSGSIKDNILFSTQLHDDKTMIEAAEIAQATEFIEQIDEKYEHNIAQGGTNVSGGQRQRLSIARAIAKKPLIYIFDDSFSALDYKTDQKLRKMLDEKIQATKLIVAQRINTIRYADQIIVLDKGTMVCKGTHHELMNSCAVYQEIASSQLSKEEL
ncbi:MAG: ABC transporter ATP-binding protein, partial [Bacillota bacterium]